MKRPRSALKRSKALENTNEKTLSNAKKTHLIAVNCRLFCAFACDKSRKQDAHFVSQQAIKRPAAKKEKNKCWLLLYPTVFYM